MPKDKMRFSLSIILAAAAFWIMAMGAALAATDMFLAIPGIPGESLDAKFPNQIVALGYSHNITTPPPASPGGASKSIHQPFKIIKSVDRATPAISQAACSGQIFATVVLTVVRTGGNRNKLIEYQLGNASITSVTVNGSTTSLLPTEEVAFAYTTIKWTYYYETSGGTLTPYVGGWNTLTNVPIPAPAQAGRETLRLE